MPLVFSLSCPFVKMTRWYAPGPKRFSTFPRPRRFILCDASSTKLLELCGAIIGWVNLICPRGSILQLLFHASEIHWQYALALNRPTRPSLNWTVVLRETDYFDEGVFFVGVFKRVDSLPFNCFLFSSVKQTNTTPCQFITKEHLPCSVLTKWIIHCWFLNKGTYLGHYF